jgi:putative redox protein
MTTEDSDRPRRAESGVATARIDGDPYRTIIDMPGGHALIADEPAFAGGGDQGPAPIDLLVAALAAGAAVTLRQHADRKGWPVTGATVSARHRRVPAREIDGRGTHGMIDVIDCDVHIRGDELSDKQRRRLRDMLAHGWVHHALAHETRINTRLVNGDEPISASSG